MKKAVLALATAATIAVTALAIPSPAEARWRGGITFIPLSLDACLLSLR